MADCMPTTSGRAELSEKEQQILGGFRVYIEPMTMYRHLQQRQTSQVAAESQTKAQGSYWQQAKTT